MMSNNCDYVYNNKYNIDSFSLEILTKAIYEYQEGKYVKKENKEVKESYTEVLTKIIKKYE
jgi:hypothetical protein